MDIEPKFTIQKADQLYREKGEVTICCGDERVVRCLGPQHLADRWEEGLGGVSATFYID